MSSLVQLARRNPVSAFAVLACLFGWMVYGFAALGIGTEPENMPLGPAMAALAVTSCQGRAELFAWGRSLRRWVASPWLYVVAVGAPIVLHVLIVLVNHWFGAPLPTADQLSAWPEIPVTFIVMMFMVGLGEEAGWTAFAAPILLRRHGLWGAFAVLAPLRILWHVPLMITGDMPLLVGLLGNAGFQLIVLQMVRRRGGSWTHAAVWHAVLNAFGGAFFFTMVTGADKDRLGTLLALAYAFVSLLTLVPALVRRGRNDPGPTEDPTTVAPSTPALETTR
ncbi:MAG: CPBP family intramembrane glutamic endopeptidase [Pedococcus sp.]